MIKINKLFVFAVLLFFLCSCVRYSKVSDVNNYFDDNIDKTNLHLNKLQQNYYKSKVIYDFLASRVLNKNIAPYAEMKKNIEALDGIIKKLQNTHNDLQLSKNTFNKKFKGNKKIIENKPQWKDYQSIKKDFSKNLMEFSSETNNYREIAKKYQQLLNKYHISLINVDNIKNRLKSFEQQSSSIIASTKLKIIESRNTLASLKEQEGEENRVIKLSLSLDKMSDLINYIEKNTLEIKKLSYKFKKEAGKSKEIWVGPGMVSHSILLKIDEKRNDITKMSKEFDQLASGLQ